MAKRRLRTRPPEVALDGPLHFEANLFFTPHQDGESPPVFMAAVLVPIEGEPRPERPAFTVEAALGEEEAARFRASARKLKLYAMDVESGFTEEP